MNGQENSRQTLTSQLASPAAVIIRQLADRAEALGKVDGRAEIANDHDQMADGHSPVVNGHDKAPVSPDQADAPRLNSHHACNDVAMRVGAHYRDQRRLRKRVDDEFASQALVSEGYVRSARRLVRTGNEDLIVAALLGLLPITTALRGALPPKSNARYERWRAVVQLVAAGSNQ
jgi:hypothetical protein